MRFFFPDTPDIPLPDGHRFPAGKYRLVRDGILRGSILGPTVLVPSPDAKDAELLLAHDAAYIEAVATGTLAPDIQRRIGLPWSATLANRARVTVGGSLAAARAALEQGVSGQLAGGTHHAHRDFGSGFCVFNDLAVTALALLEDGEVARVAILDADVHQGDGNAAILTADPRTFVASIHGEKNFPFRKVASDLDIALPDGTDDKRYLEAMDCALAAIGRFMPDIVLYLAGVDPLASDSLGRLALTHAGLAARDERVLRACRNADVPVAIVLGGGYSRPIGDSVEAYINTFRVVRQVFEL